MSFYYSKDGGSKATQSVSNYLQQTRHHPVEDLKFSWTSLRETQMLQIVSFHVQQNVIHEIQLIQSSALIFAVYVLIPEA